MHIHPRDIPPRAAWALEQAGIHPLLARLFAARGVQSPSDVDDSLTHLLPPGDLKGAEAAARLLADAIAAQQRICIVADYDCDGASAAAVALRGLRLLGAQQVDYLVPDRVVDGYGLTAAIAQRVAQRGADVLLTVDNGIASAEGVRQAKALGMAVLITDHHLPGPECPDADAIVNPNQAGCGFASKALAGVGVMFYVLLALRSELRTRGVFDKAHQPRLEPLLPLVALGTVADVVRLDANNRRLVAQGLKRIRMGHMPAGMQALFDTARRRSTQASTFDLGFALGPRINAAGRLSDMTLGIECLCTDEPGRALALAQQLDAINRERRDIESGMREQAMRLAQRLYADGAPPPAAISVLDPEFHEGVVGIVASRLKELHHRPTFVFAPSSAPGKSHEIKGSGRSIAGFHLRDALDLIAKRHPGVLLKFGGHAMAAGCTIAQEHFAVFERALAQVAEQWLDSATLTRRLDSDGPLEPQYLQAETVDLLSRQVWGQGFAAPTFSQELDVMHQRLVGEAKNHLQLQVRYDGQTVDAIWFGHTEMLPARVHMAFRLDVNEWRNQRRVQFLIEGVEGAEGVQPAAAPESA